MPYAKSDVENQTRVQALKQELARFGWAEGRNLQFDEHWTEDDMNVVRSEAAKLMASNPDVVIATGGRVVPVLVGLSKTIPIVLPGGSDPVRVGYAKSLARPGGNVTGFATFELPMLGKTLELLKQIAPGVVHVAFVYNPDNPNTVLYKQAISIAAAGPLGVAPVDTPIHKLAEIDRALASLADRGNGGVFFLPDVTTTALRSEVVAQAARYRLPAIYSDAVFAKIGGLASYAANRVDLFRRTAGYVDRILRGERPGDLPFQQPTKYELLINASTAKALRLEVPLSLLVAADEVIE